VLLALVPLASAVDLFAVDALVRTLPNGLTVVVERVARTDTVAVHLAYGVGSRDEQPAELGCAHLFEHLMFERSAHVPQDHFDRWLTAAGGVNNAWTSEDTTAYHETFPSGALDLVLFLESDRMGFLDAGLDEANLANQIAVVLQERAEGYAEPGGRDWDALSRLTWPADHPYHHPVIGERTTVRDFTIDGVRSFWKAHYQPSNAVLAIVGNVDPQAAIERVEHWFSDVPATGSPAFRASPVLPARRDGPALGVIEDDVEQRTIYAAWAVPQHGHMDEPALDLAAAILSGGHGTRIDDRLVYDSTLASDAGAFTSMGDVAGVFVLVARSDATPLERLAQVMQDELDRLGRRGPTDEEMARARRTIRASLLSSLEDPAGRAQSLAACMKTAGRPDCGRVEWSRYEATSADAVALAVRTWLDASQAALLSVVPRDDDGALDGAVTVELP
jgi:zinc protease